MASHKAADYLKKITVANLHSSTNTKDIHYVDVHDNLHHAVEVLASKHIYAIPVYDSGKPVGLLSLRSIVNFLLVLFEEKAGASPNAIDSYAKLSSHVFTTDEIKSVTDHFNKHPVSALMTKPFLSRPETASLSDIVHDFASNERVAIVNADGKIVDIVSQAVVVKYLNRHADQLGPVVNEKIENLDVINTPVHTVTVGTATILAFARMVAGNFSSLGIVDEDKTVVGIISYKDFRGAVGDFRSLFGTVESFINKIRREDFRDVNPTVNCRSADTLGKVMQKLDAVGIHRLFVAGENDKGHHFSGILTLSSVLGALLRN